jgi:hypothetical protein
LAVALDDAEGEPVGPGDAEADGLADGLADEDVDGELEGEADGDGDGDPITADGVGSLDGGGVAGTAMMTPASTASATRIPATRPARTDSRGPICRRVPVPSASKRLSSDP